MKNPKYDIVFEGQFVEGADPERVQILLGKVLKISRQDVVRICSGRRIVIQKQLDLADAHRFKSLMRKAGAVCRLLPRKTAEEGSRDLNATPPARQPRPKPHPAKDKAPAATDLDVDTPEGFGAWLKNLKVEDLRARLDSGLALLGSRIKNFRLDGRLTAWWRRRRLPAIAAALLAAVLIIAAVVWQDDAGMPADAATREAFVAGFNTRLLDVREGRSRAITYVKIAKATIEDMGFDYDKTLLYWQFNPALSEDPHQRQIRNVYLIGPLKDLFELDAARLKTLMAEETYGALENTLGIGEHITLESILMLKACARGARLVPHEALVAGLQQYDIVVDKDYPEISIEEAFYGLRQNGLIEIHKRREWKTKRITIEILDQDEIAAQEIRLRELARLSAQYVPRS
ncbi:MAG: hypothetical protein PVG19_11635 [Desulfobacterales bacterium]|jgi:hypothetical protein